MSLSDAQVEERIALLGLSGPRVTNAQIDALMAKVEYVTVQRPGGSTLTQCLAFLHGQFYLASGTSACVDPANFNANLGAEMAHRKAEAAARDKLWELMGFALFTRLRELEALPRAVSAYPHYVGTKIIAAFKIGEVREGTEFDGRFPQGSWQLVPENSELPPMEVSHAWYVKHGPQVGGYFVTYHDGHSSYSPAATFEAHYQELIA